MVRSLRLTPQLLIGEFSSEFKNNMDYVECGKVMGIQKSSSHPIIWSLQLTVMFARPSKVNLIVPSKIALNEITRISLSITLSLLPLAKKAPTDKSLH